MTSDLESVVRRFLKPMLREVVEEVLNNRLLPQPPEKKPEKERFLLRAREAAERLAISERHLHKLTVEGVLPCVRVGRLVHYSVETIERWIREKESTDVPKQKRSVKEPNPKKTGRSTAPKPKSRQKKLAGKSQGDGSNRTKTRDSTRQRGQKKTVDKSEVERTNPFQELLKGIGIDWDELRPLTNGELMRIADVDIPVFHGWMYLGRELPEQALKRLRDHFRNDGGSS